MEIKRDYYLNELIDRIDNGLIKIITGIRRCGKSYLLDPIFKEYLISQGIEKDHIIKLSLDERANNKYLDPDVLDQYIRSLIIDDKKYYLILDEIQQVKEFESVLIGFMHIKNLEIYVTGSNSKFLSSDIITEFRGRGDEIRVYPLSFDEFFSVYNGSEERALNEYYTYGGLPLTLLSKTDNAKINYLKSQKENVYINGIVEKNNVQNKECIYDEMTHIVDLLNCKKDSVTYFIKRKGIIQPHIYYYNLKESTSSYIYECVSRNEILYFNKNSLGLFGIQPGLEKYDRHRSILP